MADKVDELNKVIQELITEIRVNHNVVAGKVSEADMLRALSMVKNELYTEIGSIKKTVFLMSGGVSVIAFLAPYIMKLMTQ